MNIKIALVEDNNEFREGLQEIINSTKGFTVVAAYANGEDAVKDLISKKPDIVLMDINLPGMNGVECTQILKSNEPNLQIMMLTMFENDDNIFNSLRAGATGYIVKRTKTDKLMEAIRDLHNGGAPMSNEIARKVLTMFHQPSTQAKEEESLSERENEVLKLLAKGLRYKEIGEAIFISPETVRSHIHNIYKKLHVRSRSEAIIRVMKG